MALRMPGLKIPNARSAMPKISATTKVLRMPLVRLLMRIEISTTAPTTRRVPGVVLRNAGIFVGAASAVEAAAAGASRRPARYSPFSRAASWRRMIDVNGKPMRPCAQVVPASSCDCAAKVPSAAPPSSLRVRVPPSTAKPRASVSAVQKAASSAITSSGQAIMVAGGRRRR